MDQDMEKEPDHDQIDSSQINLAMAAKKLGEGETGN